MKKWEIILTVCILGAISCSIGCSPREETQTSTSTPMVTSSTLTTPTTSIQTTLPDVELAFPEVPRISVEELKKLIDDKADFMLVDVEDPSVFAGEHIVGAINIPYNPIDTTNTELKLIGLPKDKLIVFYCNCPGEESSAAVAKLAVGMGLMMGNIKVLRGGFGWWVTLNYPIAK